MISRIIGVLIIICIAASLKETCSGVNKNNGVISWVRTYCPIKIYELAKSFFAFIYIPISLIGLSFLCVSVFQQSFSIKLPAIAVIGISALLLTYFLITNLSLRLINITSDFTLIIKFFPLVVFFVIGFITAIFHGGSYHPLLPPDTNPNTTTPLTSQILPITGVFAILPAVFFCFDGFYAASTLTRHMKEPHKNSKAILIGLLIACVFDLGITLSLCIGSKTGSSSGFVEIFNS
ncbi:hypothetical protein FACS189459_0790 [Bacilli bacterium]|nr:hypothetical protein FACS189459_0790 [Bacilli bacterium]